MALGAFALDEAVRQEHLLFRVVILLDGADLDEPGGLQLAVDIVGVVAGLRGVGGVVVVEADVEAGKIAVMLLPYLGDEGLGGDAFLLRPQHDGGAVGVVGAHVVALVPLHLLEAHPDVGLDVFHQVAEVDAAVGIGQGGGDEYLALAHGNAVWLGKG